MKVPNWQHHSKKEAKRTLKPQALRQAKKRRAALKAKLLASTVALVGFASPAQAITWGEFWEPFKSDHHHHHYHAPRPRPMCEQREYREVRDSRGRFVEYYYETVMVPCYRKYRDHHH
jgi:hypothetical protein